MTYRLIGVVLGVIAAATPRGTRAQSDAGVRLEWYEAVYGSATHVRVADLAADGRAHIVCDAIPVSHLSTLSADPYWYVVSPSAGGFSQTWAGGPRLSVLAVANVDGDPALELLVADSVMGGTEVMVYDGGTHALERSIAVGRNPLGAAVADLDGDLTLELVVNSQGAGLQVFDALTGVMEYQNANQWGTAIGNVDGDPAMEIVSGGQVIDGRTFSVEWSSPVSFGTVQLGDLDGDGVDEIVGAYWETTSEIRIFDARRQAWIATVPSSLPITALAVVDVDGDGPLEIVYGDQGGMIRVLDGATRLVRWMVPAPEAWIGGIASGNLDADPALELVIATGIPPQQSHLHLLDAATRSFQWRSPDLIGPFQALAHGDVDADGRPEIVVGSGGSENGAAEGIWRILDAATRAEEYRSTPTPVSVFQNGLLPRLRVANVDADPQLEVIVVRRHAGGGSYLECVDGRTRTRQWQASVPGHGLDVADLEGDGSLEVIASHSGWVRVLDAASGALRWEVQLAPFAVGGGLLRVANVDGDPQLEILVGDRELDLVMVDGSTRSVARVATEVAAFDTADRDGDGRAEIVVGDVNGRVAVINPDGSVAETIVTGLRDISGLEVANLDGGPEVEYVVGSRWSLEIMGSALARPVQLGPVAEAPGSWDSLLAADVDADGFVELLVGVGLHGLRSYEVRSLESRELRAEGQSVLESAAELEFAVTLDPPHTLPVTVGYRTIEGTAQPGADYVPTSGTLTFPPGTAVRTVLVPLVQDGAWEPPESFGLRLSGGTGARIAGDGMGVILNDDPPGVFVTDATVREPNQSTAHAYFAIALGPTPAQPATVEYWTEGLGAVAGEDFGPVAGSLVFEPGVSTRTVGVAIMADATTEAPEDFLLVARRAGVAERREGTGRILDPGARFFTLSPCRALDTRDGQPLTADRPRALVITSSCQVPKTATSVAVNVTVTGSTMAGHLRLAPAGAVTTSSAINYAAGQTRANNATVPLGAGGAVSVTPGQASGTVHIILDVTGYFE